METVKEGPAKYKLNGLSHGPHEIWLHTTFIRQILSSWIHRYLRISCIFYKRVVPRLSASVTRLVELARNHEAAEEILDFDDRDRSRRRTKHRRLSEARQHILRAEDPIQNRQGILRQG